MSTLSEQFKDVRGLPQLKASVVKFYLRSLGDFFQEIFKIFLTLVSESIKLTLQEDKQRGEMAHS